jgi:hypothetical protein
VNFIDSQQSTNSDLCIAAFDMQGYMGNSDEIQRGQAMCREDCDGSVYKMWTKNFICMLKKFGRLQTLRGGDWIDSNNGDVNVCKRTTLNAEATVMYSKLDGTLHFVCNT